MDKESKRLAVHAFGMLNEGLSPLYLQARQDFLNRLAMSDVRTDQLLGRGEEGLNNAEVISRFCSALPTTYFSHSGEGYNITGFDSWLQSERPDELLAQQSSMLFIEETFYFPPYHSKGNIPFWVVGLDDKRGRILLAPGVREGKRFVAEPIFDHTGLIILDPIGQRRGHKAVSELQQHLDAVKKFYMAEAPRYVEGLLDRQQGIYRAWASSAGSYRLRKPYRYRFDYINFLSDKELANFNVADHLSRLAILFGKDDEYLQLLQH